MKSKLKIIVPLTLLLVGGVYKFAIAKPAPAPEPKVHGDVYVLPKEFLVNLADGRFAKLQVALILEPAHDEGGGGHGAAATPPEGFGPNPQEGLVRDLVTDTVTDAKAEDLISRSGREALKKKIVKRLKAHTDVHAEKVLFTDVTVQ